MNPLRIYGTEQKPEETMTLCAGPLSLVFEDGDLRYIRLGEFEVLRRIYVAVRDHNWRTIAGRISNLVVDRRDDGFEIRYDMEHRDGGIEFAWSARITGEASGRVRFEMTGRAGKDFMTNRTGFCVLHPIAPCAGMPCTIEHASGKVEEGVFPKAISPHQPFKDIRAIRHRAGDVEVRVLMEGDVFEMEDQRNWSDGSYKTYCRPLELPYPYPLKAGQEVRQSITIDLLGEGTMTRVPSQAAPAIELDLNRTAGGEWVPQIGLAAGEGLSRLSPASIAAIRSLTPRHLRVDIDLGQAGWDQKLLGDLAALRAIGVPIEVAVYMPEAGAGEALHQLASLWPQAGLTAARWLILPRRGVTTPEQLEQARNELASLDLKALFGGGTDAEFVAVNRKHPPVKQLDVMCFSLNPQVHAFDNLSLVENLESQNDVVQSAIAVCEDCPVAVTPISLRRRSNPDATGPDTLARADRLPASVDVRQGSLFAAAWTVGSLSRLCHADFLTYFETHGWRGVIQGDEDPALPQLFPGRAGEIFPVYHVLKSMLSFHPEHWHELQIRRPLDLAGILLEKPGRRRLLLANLLPRPQSVALKLEAEASLTLLDANALDQASRDAEFWINASASIVRPHGRVELGDDAIAQLDWSVG